MNEAQPFVRAYNGRFKSALRWDDLDALWSAVAEADGPWYVYAVGEEPPVAPVEDGSLRTFLDEVDGLLRREHDEDYCGIVYADDFAAPSFVKIYDPNNLGSSCGPGIGPPPLPGWILSTIEPVDLNAAIAPPANRRRWWRRLFGR